MKQSHKKKAGKALIKKAKTGRFVGPTDKGDPKAPRFEKKWKSFAQGSYRSQPEFRTLDEPVASYTSRIRAIGNSKGVIINNQLLEAAGLKQDLDITIMAGNGVIYIVQPQASDINSDLSTWDKQFRVAIKNRAKPEKDIFDGLSNNFDSKEW